MKSRERTLPSTVGQRSRDPKLIGLAVGIAICLALSMAYAKSVAATDNLDRGVRNYIVVLKDSVDRPGAVAQQQADQHDASIHGVYRYALKGYAATLPDVEVEELRLDPRVAFVTVDHKVHLLEEEVELETENNEGVEVFEQTIPTGISRIFASTNKALDIDGKDDLRADVDVAVIDTGIDYEHPDLDVEGRTICTTGTCVNNSGKDGHSHGTHVAGTIGAIDNGEGVVGVAPGTRMWGVKVLNDSGSGLESWVTAGVDWVTAHSSEIEVANMSLGCKCSMTVLDKAINKSVEAGVVYAVAAGNSNADVNEFSPAKNGNVITVSALADYDGLAGGKSSYTCQNYGLDDRKASFSNYGSGVDIVAPGVCILSTTPGKAYGLKSGTSMASPHVAGAAAILASQSNPNSQKDTETIRETLIKAGNKGWTDTSGDGVQEPLLDVSNETTFKLSTYAAAVLADAPVSYWRLGETSGTNAADEKGINPGTYQNSPTLGATSLLATATNTAVSFDGTNDDVKVPNSASLQFTSSLSLEAWIKPTSLPTSGKFASILAKSSSYALQFNGPRLEFTIFQSGVPKRLKAPEGAILTGQTYHVVGTYDGTTQRLYINGNLVASTALSGSPTTNTNVAYIGSYTGAEEFFNGTVDEPAVYGSALSASRIAAHYEAGSGAPPPPPSYAAAVLADAPVSYWRLGETSGTNAGDERDVNPGTYQGSPTLGATSLLATDTANKAVSFDGINDNVKVPSSASLQFTSSLSLEAWIKPTSLPTSGKFASILTKAESYSLQFNGPQLEFTIMQSGVRQRLKAAEGAITAGQTYHVVGTYDGITQRLYINGSPVASTALSGAATTNTNVLYIGSWNSAEEFFKGTIDEPAAYGSVLSASRIAAHYEAGT